VARFGNSKGGFDSFQIAHFTDQNNIGILAQSRPQSIGKTVGVRVHFTLVHQAAFVTVQIFDGIFNRDDVVVPVGVDLVQHSQRR
jgi:hypothetical protein